MGLFDRSKQVVTTTNNISSTTNTSSYSSSESTNIQDSGNVVTSITDAFKSSLSYMDQSVFSQPIAIMAGSGSGGGSTFDANKFFDSANAVADRPNTQAAAMSIGKYLVVGLVIVAAFYLWKKRK